MMMMIMTVTCTRWQKKWKREVEETLEMGTSYFPQYVYTGASPADIQAANNLGIPGLVYDYSKNPIYSSDNINSQGEVTSFGPIGRLPRTL